MEAILCVKPGPSLQSDRPIAVRRFAEQSKAAMLAIGAVGVSNLLTLAMELWYVAHLRAFPPQTIVEEMESELPTIAYLLAAFGNVAVTIIAAFCFLSWFYRAYTNLGHFSSLPRMYSDSWTVWGFLVPIINLQRPYSIMHEIRDRSEQAWNEHPDWVDGVARPEPRVGLWWGLYLTSFLVGAFTMRLDLGAETVGDTLISVGADMVTQGIELLAVWPTVLVIGAITALQTPILGQVLSRRPATAPREAGFGVARVPSQDAAPQPGHLPPPHAPESPVGFIT